MEKGHLSKVVLLLVMCMCATIQPASTAPLSRQQASRNVSEFLKGRGIDINTTPIRHAPLKDMNSGQDFAPYYVFNIGDGDGFVIASGDDRSRPILGYADEGKIDTDSMPDGLRWMLGFYVEQIQHAPDQVRAAGTKTSASHPAVDPLLTTKWTQTYPYNANCPMGSWRRCLTGCVATAMAQVMYDHRA